MEDQIYEDFICGFAISDLSRKYKVSKTRVYKIIANATRVNGKALNIIFTKQVNMAVLLNSSTVEEYNNHHLTPYNLSEEEFNAIKKVPSTACETRNSVEREEEDKITIEEAILFARAVSISGKIDYANCKNFLESKTFEEYSKRRGVIDIDEEEFNFLKYPRLKEE